MKDDLDELLDLVEPTPAPRRQNFAEGRLFDPGRPELKKSDDVSTAATVSELAVRAPVHAARGIAFHGDFRTQHEVHDTMGEYNPSYRAQREEEMGFSDHPVYGYMRAPSAEFDAYHDQSAEEYGDFRFTMKDSVRDRTTVAYGDTLDAQVKPVPLRDVEAGRAKVPAVGPRMSRELPLKSGYLEAQIHARPEQTALAEMNMAKPLSRVPLEDVARLDVDYPRRYSEYSDYSNNEQAMADYKDIGQQFADRGIPVWHNTSHDTYQPPLPFGDDDLAQTGFRKMGEQWLETDPKTDDWTARRWAKNLGRTTRTTHQSQL